MNLKRRLFLKKTFCFITILIIFFDSKKKLFLNKDNYKKNKSLLIKNLYFAKNKYQSTTVNIIFNNYFKGDNAAKIIMSNISKRRLLSEKVIRNKVKYLNFTV